MEWLYGALGVLQDEMALRGARCPTGRMALRGAWCPTGRMALRGAENFERVPVESECVEKFSMNPDDMERNPVEAECVVKFFDEPG